jgi:hypothetical protein
MRREERRQAANAAVMNAAGSHHPEAGATAPTAHPVPKANAIPGRSARCIDVSTFAEYNVLSGGGWIRRGYPGEVASGAGRELLKHAAIQINADYATVPAYALN